MHVRGMIAAPWLSQGLNLASPCPSAPCGPPALSLQLLASLAWSCFVLALGPYMGSWPAPSLPLVLGLDVLFSMTTMQLKVS